MDEMQVEQEQDMIAMIVRTKRDLTPTIAEFTLAPAGDETLPDYTPGAHITVRTPSGAMRRYSLVGDGQSPETYTIAVKREADSRGGSASMHDGLNQGDEIFVQPPENDFELTKADKYLLIAGGIGITPIQAMARHLDAEGKDVALIYCTRSREETAYADELAGLLGERMMLHHDDGDAEQVYDFWDHFEEPKNLHVFCCGPAPLMEEIKAISGHWPEGRVHFEDFKPVTVIREDDAAFDVELKTSGKTITVPADRTILEAVRDSGVKTVSSCESGTCGTCKTRLIEGEADHRDMVLMDDEKGDHIMICISRAKSGSLVLDL